MKWMNAAAIGRWFTRHWTRLRRRTGERPPPSPSTDICFLIDATSTAAFTSATSTLAASVLVMHGVARLRGPYNDQNEGSDE